jgi:16S rRNA (guanine527-N7)-methyltransferase
MGAGADAIAPYRHVLGRDPGDVARDLESFAALLLKWNRAQNLVSRETVDQLWPRHISDSLQALKFLRPTDRVVLDLGSGGGFPAIPLAIASGRARQFILVEPIAKKASFLRTASRELNLGLRVESRRTQEIDPRELPAIDVITSRALSTPSELLSISQPFFGPQTRTIFHRGREHVDELAESGAVWHYDVLVHPSDTDPSGVLLELSNLRLK